MKCLEKDRNRRYETASGLAMDVQRYLADEPVAGLSAVGGLSAAKVRAAKQGAGPGGLPGGAGLGGRHHRHDLGHDSRHDRAGRRRERGAAERGRAGGGPAERAGRQGPVVPGAARTGPAPAASAGRWASGWTASPPWPRPPASAPTSGCATRPSPRWPCPTSAACRAGSSRPPAPPWWPSAGSTGSAPVPTLEEIISIRSIPDDQEIRRIAAGPILGKYLYFSPDDRFLLGLGDGYTLGVWRVADGQPVLRDELRGCRAHAFSPDGRRLAVGQQEWVLCFDLATGQEVKRWRVPAPAHTLAFHPDNGKLAVGYFSSSVASVYDAASGALLTDLPVVAMSNQVVAWHPDGERLAVAGSDPRIQIWNVAAKRKVATLEGHVQHVTVLTFHPDGEPAGLARLGRHAAAVGSGLTGRQLMQLTSVSDLRNSAPTAGGWASSWHGEQGRSAGSDAEPRIPHPGQQRGCRRGRLQPRRHQPGRSPAGRGHGRRAPVCGTCAAAGNSPRCPLGRSTLSSMAILTVPRPAERRMMRIVRLPRPTACRGASLTSGSDGLLRWPVTSDDPEGKRLRLGPPQQLSPLRRAWFARSPDGRTLVAVTEEGGANKILDLETGTVRRDAG